MLRGWRWLVVIVALIGLALALQAGLVAFAGYVLLGVYLLSRYLAKAWVTNLSAERVFHSDPLEVGDTVEMTVRLTNTGTMPVGWVLIEDMVPEEAVRKRRLTIKGRRIAVLFLRPLQTRTVKYKVTFDGRGYWPLGPFMAETGDVFGLQRRHRLLAPPAYVMVLPKMLPLRKYDFASTRPVGEVRLANRLFEDPTRTAGVRPYQIGDPLQRIHWRATARTGTLHSRVFEPTSLAGASLLVDMHTDGYPKRGEPYRSDLAVTTTCSIAYAVSLLNQQLGLASNGRDAAERIRDEALEAGEPEPELGHATRSEVRDRFEMLEQSNRLRPVVVDTRRGFDQFERIRETLARLELTDGRTFAEMAIEVAPRLPRDATVVAILPRVPVESALALGLLRRQGFAVSAVLVGMAEDGSDDRAVAAGRLIAEGVRDVRFVNTEAELMNLGDRSAPGPAEYGFLTQLA
ncbi:MAG TPA: DUF58 domain-containing protein [Fimbriiglobus sp.]|jgi:uncharacterized protein (DUF58 family)|nr:DUF58 domain-containing protein [Fimbriiglobus sp.]